MKKLFILLILFSFSFAGWSGFGGLALQDYETITASANPSIRKSVTVYDTDAITGNIYGTLTTVNVKDGAIKVLTAYDISDNVVVTYNGSSTITFDTDGDGAMLWFNKTTKLWQIIGNNGL